MNDRTSLARKALYSAAVFVLFFGIVEGALRIAGVESYAENQFFPLNRDISFVGIYDKDSELFWRLKKDILAESHTFSDLSYQINNAGFRGPDISDDPGKPTILALGNSCTFGWGVPYDSIFTARLAHALPEYRVVNVGVPGYSSFQGRILYDRLAAQLRPAITLIMFGWNDHWPAGDGISDREQQMPPQWALDIQNDLSRLRLFQFVRKLTLSFSAPDKSARPAFDQVAGERRVSLADFRKNLQAIVEQARSLNSQPYLLIPPIASLEIYMPEATSSAFHDLHKAYQQAIKQVGSATGTPVIDLQAAFDRRNDLFSYPREDPAHFNSAGHAVVCESVLQVLRPANVKN